MKSLPDKLGYKSSVPALMWPATGSLGANLSTLAPGEEPSFILAFVCDRAALSEAATAVLPSYRRGGHLWLAYPNKSGAIRYDLSRDKGWEHLAGVGLMPLTQIVIDHDWSGSASGVVEEIRQLTRKAAALDPVVVCKPQ
ncbi:hypothetical protein [Sphingomonas glaciei]|uniref:DUF3052 domain-containing protein n=1 Tax=Sphingomonas glaciei TaxID=2938948 RepID=A0ABY5MY69_9SPHN|nr:hypothetical protein [Sphingomonas glaciei]UUR08954.1 hypothetical protein M1K48_04815 [Sphingomonas glaciei]